MLKAQFSKKEIAITFQTLVVAGKVHEAYNRFIHPDFRHHNPYFPGDRASLLKAMKDNAQQFPNKKFEVQRALEEGNLVAIHSRLQLQSDMPEVAVVHIFRFEGDKIVEEWDLGQQVPDNCPNENTMF